MIELFSKYRKVPKIVRQSIKDIDRVLSECDKQLLGQVVVREDLGGKRNHIVSRIRKNVDIDPKLRSYMGRDAYGAEFATDDYYFMLFVYYWMFLNWKGFDTKTMDEELSCYMCNGEEAYGIKVSAEEILGYSITVTEAATIDEPVLDPVERGERD